ncbi:MAG: VOC family protein [Erysipelotrichaceae bacterium]|nr:VOC family protein [Erysipelotrichaceae bacterium]
MLKEGSITFLPCRDIEKTREFYEEVLGLSLAMKQGETVCIFDCGYGYWGFCQYSDSRKPLSVSQGVCLSLNYPSKEEVDHRYEELKGRCTFTRLPQKHPLYPVYSCFLQDPDGYTVELQTITEK